MKKQNWGLGIIISVGISMIGVSQKLIRVDQIDLYNIAISFLYSFIICFTGWISHVLLFRKNWIGRFITNTILKALLSITLVTLLLYAYRWLLPEVEGAVVQFTDLDKERAAAMLLFRSILVSSLFYFVAYYLHILSEKQKSSIEIEHLKQAQLEASLSSLKEQLSPHFLFNTLNTLSSLTSEGTVKEYISELSEVYRYLLQYKENNTATLRQELNFIESYLYIIKTRLEDAIGITVTVEEEYLSAAIPPLTLQLVIENAIKHNVASSSRKLEIAIFNQGHDYLVVQNNYQPKSSVQHATGIGLNNIMQRYGLLFKKEIRIEKTDASFIVKLPLL
ncbi:sensor histidine kinase [Flavobacterium sp. RHBU_24]|uniref:sensor histidine kinase n=1 Tax=Flavobacterium sp. RHBU_24 TaxID=3391185 RepID=UPI003984A992